MTVNELLARLGAAFPAFNARALEAWAPVFRARLGRHEGPVLAKAFADTLGNFTVKASKALFPMPADFDAYLPSGKLNPSAPLGAGTGREHGKKLDLEGRKRRADSLFANWQAGQCSRADKGNPMLRRALEHIARPIADTLGWDENPEPLVLTREQIRVAYQRAISMERRQRYQRLPANRFVWWQQIQAVATEWGIQLTPEQWDDETARHLAVPQDYAA